MRKLVQVLCFILPVAAFGQVTVNPGYTVSKVNNSGNSNGPLGRTGGVTFTFTKNSGVFDSCTYWGFVSGTNGDIKMALNNLVTPPTLNCTFTGAEYFPGLTGVGTNTLNFTGSSSIYCQNTSDAFVTRSLNTRATVTVSNGTFLQSDSFLLVKVAGLSTFDVTVLFEAYGPSGVNYFTNYTNTWTPAVMLFDALHTQNNRSICTSFESALYAYSAIKADTIVGAPDTVCNGNTAGILTASATGGSSSYSYQWYSNGTQISGATSANYSTPVLTSNTSYFCIIYDSCSAYAGYVRADTTDTVDIIVNGMAAVGGTSASDQVLCPNITPNTINLSGYSNGTISKWQIATDNLFTSPIDIANTTDSLTGAQIETAAGGSLTNSYYIRAVVDNSSCPESYSSVSSLYVNEPNNLTFSDDTGICFVNGTGGWVHFYHPTNRNIIASVNSNGQNLGETEVMVFQHGGNALTVNTSTRCLKWHAVMNRSFVLNSANTFSNPVSVRLYFTDAELAELIDTSLTTQNTGGATSWPTNDPVGCEDNDDVLNIGDVLVTQISSAVNENGSFDIYDGVFKLHTPVNSGIGNGTFGANYVQFNVTEFSEFWLHGSQTGIPLPVELIKFDANLKEDDVVKLTWTTATEINNEKFEIYRKLDGEEEFVKIGELPGAGNNNAPLTYNFEDKVESIFSKTAQYYLKQIDFNGDYDQSNIVIVDLLNRRNKELVLYPNPATTELKVFTFSKHDEFEYEITNLLGEVLLEGNLVNGDVIKLQNLNSGMYLLTLKKEGVIQNTSKFNVQ